MDDWSVSVDQRALKVAQLKSAGLSYSNSPFPTPPPLFLFTSSVLLPVWVWTLGSHLAPHPWGLCMLFLSPCLSRAPLLRLLLLARSPCPVSIAVTPLSSPTAPVTVKRNAKWDICCHFFFCGGVLCRKADSVACCPLVWVATFVETSNVV